jgi:peptide/nickel transport system substrate-binding protein
MRTWRLFPVFAVLALVLAACGEQGASPSEAAESQPATESEGAEPSADATDGGTDGEPQSGGTLVYGAAAEISSLDPSQTSDGESFRVLQQVYEPLVDLAAGTVDELVGVLAESWEGEPEDDVYVFNLKQGVTFHDGTPFNAEAVKINFDRWDNFAEEFQGNAYYYGAVMNGFGENNLIESVEATDEYTVTITLTEPSPTFLYGIALTPFSIVSPAVLEATNADDPTASTLGTEVVQGGTGPFILEEWIPQESATFSRNEDYHGEHVAYLDRLIIRPIPDSAARLQALQGGSLQGFDLIAPGDRSAVDGVDGYQLVNRQSYNTLYLGVNPTATENGPLADLLVRQAVAHAIDKEALIGPFYGGGGSPADCFLPPTSGWHETVCADVDALEFNTDTARDLLEQAGFTEDNPATVNFWFPTEVVRPYMPDARGLHEAITTMLEDAGFVVEPGSAVWGTEYIPAAQAGEYDLHFLGWTGDYDDPSNWYGVHFGFDADGNPAAQFDCDVDGLEDAINEAEGTLEQEARAAAWGEVAQIVHNEVCFITLVHGDTGVALTDAVRDFVANPTGSESFVDIWLASE